MRILVLGAGMVAHFLRPCHGHFPEGSGVSIPHEIHFASRTAKEWENFHLVDIRDPKSLEIVTDRILPDVIINTAVLGNIRQCEENPGLAEDTNHLGHRNVINLCNDRGIKLIFISTSSVFSGSKGNYGEEDVPHPTTIYGQTKLRGEEATREESHDWAIFRLTAIFGDYPGDKQDFIRKTIRDLGAGRSFGFWDQVISPSFGPFVAKAIMRLVERDAKGIWHIAGNEQLTRIDIGRMIRERLLDTIMNITPTGHGRSAPRSRSSESGALSCNCGIDIGEVRMVGTPAGLPRNRSLCVDKLKRELPELDIPDLGSCVEEMIRKCVVE